MRVYNAYSGMKEEFIPIEEGKVKMYACGITVYDDCHIGHARQAIIFDIINRYLKFRGYDVTYVRNYTDVDDKIIARANSLNMDVLAYSQKKVEEAEEDLSALKVIDADIKPKASEYVERIIRFAEGLIHKGHAYPTARGDVYFSVESFKGYGKLSNRNTDELLSGVRKEVEEGKQNPLDFALWKSAKEGEISWNSPWGKGRPGWHIECSAMVLNTLGESIDIHGGGKDLIFPHHENEIAQSEAYTGKPFAKYWVHNGLITINGQKMSKSLGNSLTIKEVLSLYHPEVIRYAMIEKHYSSNVDLNEKVFQLAENQLYYFYQTLDNINAFINNNGTQTDSAVLEPAFIEAIGKDFTEAMDDDFNTAAAIAQLFSICKHANTLISNRKHSSGDICATLGEIRNKTVTMFSLLGLLQETPESFVAELKNKHLKNLGITQDEIQDFILQRNKAKQDKNYEVADKVRNELLERGIILNDSKEGTRWDIKELYNIG